MSLGTGWRQLVLFGFNLKKRNFKKAVKRGPLEFTLLLMDRRSLNPGDPAPNRAWGRGG